MDSATLPPDTVLRPDAPVTLDDKYARFDGRVYLTGIQALVRLPIVQQRRDRAAGLHTAGFISGYRGSPLGGYDLALWGARRHLEAHDIRFQPGINEDLAATAVWGSQQIGLIPEPRYDGVFGLWYGKGPGVDRSGDVLKHATYQGTAKHGGAIALCGDDHGARSSTLAHQSDFALIHYGMPLLNPATVEELLLYGLQAWAMSRFSGSWIGMKALTDTVEGGASIPADMDRLTFITPDFPLPPDGLNIRPRNGSALEVEQRHYEQRLPAVQAWVRANRMDRLAWGGARRHRLGIVSTGKAYLDVVEALRGLGLDEARTAALGIGVYKVALAWPLEPAGLREFAETCDEIFVVEEKRPIIEDQISTILYNLPAEHRPRLTGKLDENGAPLLKAVGELDPDLMLHIIANRLRPRIDDPALQAKIAAIKPLETGIPTISFGVKDLLRPPSFCAGCPHNTSTRVPDGSIAAAGIGCHIMATALPDRNTMAATHMGGEGATWIGQAPFTETKHIFQNIGDGTYFHSGLLAIRASLAAGVNITYKVLLNGAIAMTGGQPIEGEDFSGAITGPHVASQLAAEGVKRIALVSDDPTRHDRAQYPAFVTYHHRDELDAVQRELRDIPGVTAIIYDQACATERRRLRKRGKLADPAERLFIHPEVCEGCGDCGVQSNCIAVEPEETKLGRKRRINQSVCNKDFSCAKGLCPSFVTVLGGHLRARAEEDLSDEEALLASLPEPTLPRIGEVYNVLLAGIGGNGVVTVSALLGMAAHIEGRELTVLDNSGLAQRNGSVTSHVRIGDGAQRHSPRIPNGDVDLVIGADPMVVAIPETLAKLGHGRSAVLLNRFVAPNATFASNPDADFRFDPLLEKVRPRADAERIMQVNATAIASTMLGNAIGANLFLVGYAWQKGLIPLGRESILRAIELNGTEVAMNRRAFGLGRIAAARPDMVKTWLRGHEVEHIPDTLGDLLADRMPRLTAWGGARHARRYRALVAKMEQAEARIPGQDGRLARAVAHVAAKLMTYKDEYEVARLYADPGFAARLRETFEGEITLNYNLAPPLLSPREKRTGRPRKRRFGAWMGTNFRLLAKLRFLRGTPLDLFGYMEHRRMERGLVRDYAELVGSVAAQLTPDNYAAAEPVLRAHDQVRGFDVVKDASVARVRKALPALVEVFERATAARAAAE